MSTPIWRRYLRLFGTDVAADVDDELQFHLAMRTEELVEEGWAPEEARQEAERLFGNVSAIASECRQLGERRLRTQRRSSFFKEISRDLAFALRMANGRRLLSAVVIVSLALGIGVNIAIFSVIKGVLLDRLPVERADELVLFKWTAEEWPRLFSLHGTLSDTDTGGIMSSSFSYSAYRRLTEHQDVLSSVFAFAPIDRLNVNVNGEAVLAEGQVVSGTFFPALGLRPKIGRLIGPGDDRPESAPVVVLSHAFWRRQLHSDPSVLGRPVTINGHPFSVVGIAPRGFDGTLQIGDSPAIYLPLAQVQRVVLRQRVLESPNHWFLRVMGRLEPGVDLELARSTLAPLLLRTVEEDLGVAPGSDGAFAPSVPRLILLSGSRALDERRADMVGALTAALGVTVLVLIIACANAATLMLAGAVARRREMAVRLSLGAGMSRITRQLVTENLLLAAAAGVLGFILSLWMSRGMVLLLSSQFDSQLVLDVAPDLGVVGFAVLASLLTGISFGIAPALKMSRIHPAEDLRGGDDRGGQTRSSFRIGRILVVGQVALSLILLIVAGLFFQTVTRLASVDPGFSADGVLMFGVDPNLNGYSTDRLFAVCDEIKLALEALPGTESVTSASFELLSGSGAWDRVRLSDDEKVGSFVGAVDADFLETLGIELLEGRNLSANDRADSTLVAIVNQTFARRAFGDESAVGREISHGEGEEREVFRVVGVFRDGNSVSLHDERGAITYIPHQQASNWLNVRSRTFYIRTALPPAALAENVRKAVAAIDRDLPIFELKTMHEQISRAIAQERHFGFLSGVGAAFALVLACIGLYGVVAFSFSRRIHEIGIRLSLGASRRDILFSATRELNMVVFGIVVGLVGAVLATRWLDDLLFELTATDPITLAAAATIMMAVGALAVFLPARRATRVDPMEVLRAE
jgi:predicted permease